MKNNKTNRVGYDDIVPAALDILGTEGLEAVGIRAVANRLGVSPMPLYTNVGNKEALLDAVAERWLADVRSLTPDEDESWPAFMTRWARSMREALRYPSDICLLLTPDRTTFAECTRPLIAKMRDDGLQTDIAIRAVRLLIWSVLGFASVERSAVKQGARRRRPAVAGGDADQITDEETDALFEYQLRLLVDGLAREHAADEDREVDGK